MELEKEIEKKAYLILFEKNILDKISGANQNFEAEIISLVNFEAEKAQNFTQLKKMALKKMTNIFIIEVTNPIVKIIPEAKLIINK